MRVAFLINGWPPDSQANGVVSAVAELLDPLRQHGIEPVVLAWSGERGREGREVHILSGWRSPSGLQRGLDRITWSLDRERSISAIAPRVLAAQLEQLDRIAPVDLIEIEESWGWASGLKAQLGIPVVVALHGPWFLHGPLAGDTSPVPAYRRRVRSEGRGIRAADFLLAPTVDVLERTVRFYGLGQRSMAVLPYAYPVSPVEKRWRAATCNPEEVLFVGRFDLHKGGDIVIDAFSRVLGRRPGARLIFVGPDRGLRDAEGRHWNLSAYVASRVGPRGRLGAVEIMGQLPRSAVDSLRRRALVTVSCSRWENLSLAVLEAMACGCPVVIADRGGLPEHVFHQRTGLVFRAGDPVALADCLLALMDDVELAARLGQAALDHLADNLDPTRIALQRAKLYERVAHSGTKGGPS